MKEYTVLRDTSLLRRPFCTVGHFCPSVYRYGRKYHVSIGAVYIALCLIIVACGVVKGYVVTVTPVDVHVVRT